MTVRRVDDETRTSIVRGSVLRRVLPCAWAVVVPLCVAGVAARGEATIRRVTASRNPRVHHVLRTLDGSVSTGWSVHGDGNWVCYEFDQPARVGHVGIAWAAGDERRYRFDIEISSAGTTWTRAYSGTSSGTTRELEIHTFEAVDTRLLRIVGHGSNKNTWVNIMECTIDSVTYVPPPDPEITRFTPPPDGDGQQPRIYAVSARSSARDTLPHHVVDGDPATGWSAQDDGQWLTVHISPEATVDSVGIAWVCPHPVDFEVRVSLDGRRWSKVFSGTSEGTAGEGGQARFEPAAARYVRIVVFGSDPRHWHRLSEIRVGDLGYEPTPQAVWWTRRWESGPPGQELLDGHVPAARSSNTDMARRCIETLIEKGTDRYGEVHAPVWVLNLDLDTLECFPRYNDGLIERAALAVTYSMTAPYGVGHRAIRGSQREAGCSNLFVDQPMIRAARLYAALTGDGRFAAPVRDYVQWCFEHLMNEETGLMDWGVHTSYDVYDDRLKAADGFQHELLGILPNWPLLTEVDAEKTAAYMARIWSGHTDPETGQVDRHATRGRGLDFAAAAGEIVLVCAYLHGREPHGPWLERALKVAHSHWDTRHPRTGLFVNTPHGGTGKRFDNTYSDTTITGYWVSRLLLAGRLTGSEELLGMARGTLLSWARYGWDEETGQPWASVRPDGTPNRKPRDYSGTRYDKFDPSGHWDYWKDYVYGFEAPFATLMTYAVAALWLRDAELTAHAVRLAECYRARLPANGRAGTFAASYGQLISFFLVMQQLTGDSGYRASAEAVADEALGHLWTGHLFRGFAGRRHYTAVEGAGYLVQALFELDADPGALNAVRARDVFLWNF